MNTIVNVPAVPRGGSRGNTSSHETGGELDFQLALGLAAASQSRTPLETRANETRPVDAERPESESPAREQETISEDEGAGDGASERASEAASRASEQGERMHGSRARAAADSRDTTQNVARPAAAAETSGEPVTASGGKPAATPSPVAATAASAATATAAASALAAAAAPMPAVADGEARARVVSLRTSAPVAMPVRASAAPVAPVTPAVTVTASAPITAPAEQAVATPVGGAPPAPEPVEGAGGPLARPRNEITPAPVRLPSAAPLAQQAADALAQPMLMDDAAGAPQQAAVAAVPAAAAQVAETIVSTLAAPRAPKPARVTANAPAPAPAANAARAAEPEEAPARPAANAAPVASAARARTQSDTPTGRDGQDFARSNGGNANTASANAEAQPAAAPAASAPVSAAATATAAGNASAPVVAPTSSDVLAGKMIADPNAAAGAQNVNDPRLEPMRRAADQVTLQFQGEAGLEGRLRISVRGDSVRASILSSHDGTLQRAGGELNALKRALADQGFTDAKLSVHDTRSLATTATSQSREQSQTGEERRQGEPQRKNTQGRETRQDGGGSNRSRRGPRDERRDA